MSLQLEVLTKSLELENRILQQIKDRKELQITAQEAKILKIQTAIDLLILE